MFKRVMAILLALSMLLCFSAYGRRNQSSGPEAKAPDHAPAGGRKTLSDEFAELGAESRWDEVTLSMALTLDQANLAREAVEQAGLSENEDIQQVFADFGGLIDLWEGFLSAYLDTTEEERAALDEDETFMDRSSYYIQYFSKFYNMMVAMQKDPARWLTLYTLEPQSQPVDIECDGTWPKGYFFSDRVPELERVDEIQMTEKGKEYGFEGGIEYAILGFTEGGMDEAHAYVARLAEAGFQEAEPMQEDAIGWLSWRGTLDDSEGHIDATVIYIGSALMSVAGDELGSELGIDLGTDTAVLLMELYNWDYVGLQMDLGQIS